MPAFDTVVDSAMTATVPSAAAAAEDPVPGGARRPIAPPPASTWGTSAALGTAACGALYLLVSYLPADSWLYPFLMSRGVLQWVMLTIALSAAASLAQLSWRSRAQRDAAAKLLTASVSWPRGSLPEVRRQVKAMVEQFGEGSWAAQRLVQVVQAVAAGDNSPSERARLAKGSREVVDEQYQLARSAAGALPVVGLAATVWMLSAGMSNLAAFARLASDFGSLRNMLGGFGGSLTSAFDSTLMSLLLMVPVMLLAGIARARDEATLKVVDRLAGRLAATVRCPRPEGPNEAFIQATAAGIVDAVQVGLERMIDTLRGTLDARLPKIGVEAQAALASLPAVLVKLNRTIASPPAARLPEAVETAAAQIPALLRQVTAALGEPRRIELSVPTQLKP